MEKKKVKEVTPKIGDFVRVRKGHGSYNNRIGVYVRDNYDGDRVIGFSSEDDYTFLCIIEQVQVVKPLYVVTWATTEYDPFEYAETLEEATKLATKLAKKRDIVSVNVYKLSKKIK